MKLRPILFALLITPLFACGSTTTAQRYDDALTNNDRRYDIDPEGEILASCGIDASRSYFAYASSELTEDDKTLLSDVGRCMTSGRLAGRSILVTGYTDDSGGLAYNQALGLERSRSVAAELSTRGVPQTRIFVRSMGMDQATGDTDSGRALDRKVDLRLLARN